MSEGRDGVALAAIGAAFTGAGARVLDVHADVDHHRSVFTLAGRAGRAGARAGGGHRGGAAAHRPLRWSAASTRTSASSTSCHSCTAPPPIAGRRAREALVAGGGDRAPGRARSCSTASLAGGRTRAEIRRGGPAALAERLASGELTPGLRARRGWIRARGATLVAARPPLIAFNLEVDAPLDVALAAARAVREGGADGPAGGAGARAGAGDRRASCRSP